ncbi:2-oxoglutarate dehydrogenase, E2 component, dihydrolipoamide succinyltransferase [Kocuria sabuli]|uniref:2-oxoglutarate dehydrogenase, E2 component, dihydrolipoamide succinyltransferase n=1 Tax=Kocuria sabuli TaxID=3071448 RepID=UPI0034D7B05F
MSETVNLPALGESVTEGTVTRWLKQVGDEVAVDEPLVEVSTDKVDTEIPSPVAGVIEEILVEEDEDVEVGAPLVVIGDGSGSAPSQDEPSAEQAEDAATEAGTPEATDEAAEQQAPKKKDSGQEQAPQAEAQQSGEGTEITLPALGESVTEGTVTRWLKQVGDEVAVDEPLLEVSTDKVDTEIPSPAAGTLLEIRVQEDEDAEVGQVLAIIGSGSAPSGSAPSQDEPSAEQAEDAATEAGTPEATDEAAEQQAPKKKDSGQEQAPQAEAQQSGEGTEITLPALGESVTEGTVTRWLKQVGDEVAVDEPLLEVSTDKVDTEIPSPAAGTLLEIRVQEDEDAEVGQVLAIIGSGSAPSGSAPSQDEPSAEQAEDTEQSAGGEGYEGSAAGAPEKAQSRDEALVETEEPVLADTSGDEQQDAAERDGARTENADGASEAPTGDNSAYVTPLVRKLAKKEGVDLSTITGTGVGGRIRKQDVLAAAEQQKGAEAPAAEAPAEQPAAEPPQKAPEAAPKPDAKRGTTEKAPRIRMTIAQRMRESLQESAQLTQVTEVDMTRVAALRDKAKAKFQEREGAKLTFLPFFAKAVAEALQAHPKLNATFREAEKEIVYNGSENIAIAVDTPRGLLVPVIKNAGDLNLGGLAKQIADLGSRAKDGNITPDDLTGGTFTITNIGSFGALFDTPIINQPQVAILGTGSIVKRPMVVADADGNDSIAVRQMCYLSLTYDHRLVDGADAGRFLQALKARLQEGRFESEVGL